ncbi:hypothetical protein [Bradyrhizobium sp. Gha]|uniref:hypothetical protein n=1 Tax=Bradyrhizobium sp. Gha TaxID=1855318 RepID=UPI0008F44BDA|nr:hypothetical protein [Bradyrhizobium sp. Gha]SFI12837.1 hypothetical protein SAMN05216525_104257 [Bradyrhizobium sp. Gha]
MGARLIARSAASSEPEISSAPLGDPPYSSYRQALFTANKLAFIRLSFTKRDQIAQSLGAVCFVKNLGKLSGRIFQELLAISVSSSDKGMQIECVHSGGRYPELDYLFEELARSVFPPRSLGCRFYSKLALLWATIIGMIGETDTILVLDQDAHVFQTVLRECARPSLLSSRTR